MSNSEDSGLRGRHDTSFMSLIVAPDVRGSEDDISSDWLRYRSINHGEGLVKYIYSISPEWKKHAIYVDSELFEDAYPQVVQLEQEPCQSSSVRSSSAKSFRKKLEDWYLSSGSTPEKKTSDPILRKHASSLNAGVPLTLTLSDQMEEMTCPLCSSILTVGSFEKHVQSCMQDIGSDFSDYGGPLLLDSARKRLSNTKANSFMSISTEGSIEKLCVKNPELGLGSKFHDTRCDLRNTNGYKEVSDKLHINQETLRSPFNARKDDVFCSMIDSNVPRTNSCLLREERNDVVRTTINTTSMKAGKVVDIHTKQDLDTYDTYADTLSLSSVVTPRKVPRTSESSSSNQSHKLSSEIVIDYDEADHSYNNTYPSNIVLPLDLLSDDLYNNEHESEQKEYTRKELASLSPLNDFIDIKKLFNSAKPYPSENIRMYFNQFPDSNPASSTNDLDLMMETLLNKSKTKANSKQGFRSKWRRFGSTKNARSKTSSGFHKSK